ncbi:hypothetical protein DIURU_002320 [Diutina rugosa]|uniref:candidapepsin n=1 Tax=Diutina rugosa TaxID=5481 RepID=A0A642UR86_DIURU|nr:uncharacterized protein DIURU_002320 [Diutina rugosa]KAA8903808.1 hypothetical protein DIURU_002320 [Diutina rugosa]
MLVGNSLLWATVALAGVPLPFSVRRGDSNGDVAQKSINRAYFSEGPSARRDGHVEIQLHNEKTFYVSELEISGQKVEVLVDTGSADLWVPSGDVDCHQQSSCTKYGSFSPEKSDSWKKNSTAPAFEISYTDKSKSIGTWGHDDVSVSGTTVKSLSFAVVNQTSSNVGVLGIGPPKLEVTNSANSPGHSPYVYENLPVKLRNQGLIKRTVFSVYMDASDADQGTILFGAIDSAKFDDKLTRVPIVNTRRDKFDEPAMVDVVVNGINIVNGDDTVEISKNKYYALLDTGSTVSYLPKSLYNKLTGTLGATQTSIGAQIDCKYRDSDVDIEVSFSGVSIKFPVSDLIVASTSSCYLGMFPQDLDSITLGDNMLRHVYLVYDYDNFEVALAQTKFTSDTSFDEVDSPEIPNAVTAKAYSETDVKGSVTEDNASTTIVPQAKAVTDDSGSSSDSKSDSASETSSDASDSSQSSDSASSTDDSDSSSASTTDDSSSTSDASSTSDGSSTDSLSKTTSSSSSASASGKEATSSTSADSSSDHSSATKAGMAVALTVSPLMYLAILLA